MFVISVGLCCTSVTLAPADRMLLRCASVLGAIFELPLLATILGGEIDAVDDPGRWGRLAEFVSPTPDGSLAYVTDRGSGDVTPSERPDGHGARGIKSRRRERHGRHGHRIYAQPRANF